MSLGKRLLLIALTPLLPLFLFALAFDYGVISTVGNVTKVKHTLSDSGIYSSVVPSLLKQNGQISTALGNISASDPLVQQAVKAAVPTAQVQKNSEVAIDNLYAWLNGKTDQPSFNLNFAGSSDSFAASLSDSLKQKLASLPACTTPLTVSSFDALNATCLPPGVSANSAANILKNDLSSSGNLLSGATISSNDFKGNNPQKTVFQDQLSSAPKQYHRLKTLPTVLAVLAVITAASLIFLRPTLKSGLRHTGTAILVVGLIMLIFAYLFNLIVAKRMVSNIHNDNLVLQQNIKTLASDLSQSIDRNYWTFGALYSLVGGGLVASPYLLNRGKPKVVAEKAVATSNEPDAADDMPEPKDT